MPFYFDTKVKESDVTYCQYFQFADHLNARKNLEFYHPLKGYEAMQVVAAAMGNVIHPIKPENLLIFRKFMLSLQKWQMGVCRRNSNFHTYKNH